MKRRLVVFLWLIVVLLSTCTSTKPQPETGKGTLFLWKLEKGTAVLYFFGSLHMGLNNIYPLPDQVYQAYNEAEKLVVELNAKDSDNQIVIQQLVMQKGMFSEGETITDHVSPEISEKIIAFANEYGIPAEGVVRLKPWVIELTISSLEMQKYGYDPMLGLDVHFIGKAEEDNKEIAELETAEEQINLLSDISIQDQVQSLEFTLADIEHINEDLDVLVNAWKSGDTEEFAALTKQSFDEKPEFKYIYERLFTKRNIQWVARYEEMIKAGGKYFIVTGAGHLAGADSVIDLLRAKGYKVTQL